MQRRCAARPCRERSTGRRRDTLVCSQAVRKAQAEQRRPPQTAKQKRRSAERACTSRGCETRRTCVAANGSAPDRTASMLAAKARASFAWTASTQSCDAPAGTSTLNPDRVATSQSRIDTELRRDILIVRRPSRCAREHLRLWIKEETQRREAAPPLAPLTRHRDFMVRASAVHQGQGCSPHACGQVQPSAAASEPSSFRVFQYFCFPCA